MMTAAAIYFIGMAITAVLVRMLPGPPPRRSEWALALLLWPLTILAMIIVGVNSRNKM